MPSQVASENSTCRCLANQGWLSRTTCGASGIGSFQCTCFKTNNRGVKILSRIDVAIQIPTFMRKTEITVFA